MHFRQRKPRDSLSRLVSAQNGSVKIENFSMSLKLHRALSGSEPTSDVLSGVGVQFGCFRILCSTGKQECESVFSRFACSESVPRTQQHGRF